MVDTASAVKPFKLKEEDRQASIGSRSSWDFNRLLQVPSYGVSEFNNTAGMRRFRPAVSYVYPKSFRKDLTDSYKSFHLGGMIQNIDYALRRWEANGDPLASLSSIKEAIKAHEDILKRSADSRILLSLIQMIFQNNNWNEMNVETISMLRKLLERFGAGDISDDMLEVFTKTIYRNGISPLGNINSDQA